jgi:ankyrin repeat protein
MDMYVTSCEPLNGDCLLHVFARRNDDKELLRLIEENSVDRLNNRRETPLIVAAQNSAVRVAKKLIASNANINAQDADGNTPLHHAVLSQSTRFIAILQAQKVNGNIVNNNEVSPANQPINWQGETPMHIACKNGQLLALDCLIYDGQFLDPIDNRQRTPLMLTIENSHNRLALALLAAKGPNNSTVNVNAKDSCGNTALHYCSLHANTFVANLLINYGANIHEVNILGFTPYTMLTQFGTMEDSVIYQQVYKQHLQSNTAENERRNPSPTYSDFDFSLDDFL